MDFTFETQGANTYLVYKIGKSDALDSLSIGMVTNNKIKGIAPILLTQMNSERFIKYNITAKVPVEKFFTGVVTKKRLLSVFYGIADAILAAEEYMIDSSMLIYDLEYIFVDVTTCEIMMICLPITNADNNVKMSTFYKDIVFSTQFDQTENNNYVAKVISYLNGSSNFSLNNFSSMIKELLTVSSYVAQNKPANQYPLSSKPAPILAAANTYQPVESHTPMKQKVQTPELATQPQQFVAARSPNVQKEKIDKMVTTTKEKKVSMVHLLMHYSKENKEAYKAQKKENKKRASICSSKNDAELSRNDAEFDIPGREASIPSVESKPSFHGLEPKDTIKSADHKPIAKQTNCHQISAQMSESNTVLTTSSVNFGETTLLDETEIGGTTVLSNNSSEQESLPYLIRYKNNEKIYLSKPVFRIGKEKSFVDYFISDNPAISRSHADFLSRSGEHFITDMNSTNHTYVNGEMIKSSVEVKLVHRTKIKLANEEFEFRLY